MGFWDSLVNMANEKGDNIKEKIKNYENQYRNYDTDRLKEMYKNEDSPSKKMAIKNILQSR